MKVTLNINSYSVKWMLYLSVAVIYAVAQINVLMYLIILVQLFCCVKAFLEREKKYTEECIDLILISLIMPDNYCVIFISLLVFFFAEREIRMSVNAAVLIMISLAYVFWGILMNGVRIPNIFMSLVYMLPFRLQESSARNLFQKKNELVSYLCRSIKKVILIEILATVVYALTHMNIVAKYADMDWVTGTLGAYQCNVLMFICSISILLLWAECEKGKKSNILWIALGGALVVATGAVAYTLIFSLAIIVIMLFDLKIPAKMKLGVLLCLVVAGTLFVLVVPDWMVGDIIKMTDKNYLVNRVAKLKYYQNTFVEMPRNEGAVFFLFGTGIGQYSSRAAATCAGGYIGGYDRFFSAFETVFREKYISAFDFGEGILALPYASIMSLQGEVGFFGLAAVLTYFIHKFMRAGSRTGKIAIVYFVGLMFIENTLEFAKYGALLWIVYYACQRKNDHLMMNPNKSV